MSQFIVKDILRRRVSTEHMFEYEVKWEGFEDTDWVKLRNLNACGLLLLTFELRTASKYKDKQKLDVKFYKICHDDTVLVEW